MMSRNRSTSIKLSFEIDIEASCAIVYDKLNLHSPRNRYIERGFSLTPRDGQKNHFIMTLPNLPDLQFFMQEHCAIPYERYDIHCDFPPGEPVGILTGDRSSYRLKPLKDDHCRLTCHVDYQTVPLSEKDIQEHSAMLTISLHDDIARLKALIEDGVKAAEKAGALDELLDFLESVA